MVRSEDPVSYWIVMVLLSVAVAACCYLAAGPWIQGGVGTAAVSGALAANDPDHKPE